MIAAWTTMSRTTPTYIAVVDDDESLCRSLGRLLRAAGTQPVMYASAEDFLADTKCPQFGCLVLDVQLGGMSGIELAQRLLAEGNLTPFIFITAHDDDETRDLAEAAGCAAYFHKTDSGSDLLETIRRLTGLNQPN
jgi:FixJ family two-component response regulator